MPLGNDIIDLSAGRRHRPAYYDRLRSISCHDRELELVRFLPDIDGLWLLWSIKEAAFKSAVKLGWDIRFAGKDFPVTEVVAGSAGYKSRVLADTQRLTVHSDRTTSWIHSFVEIPDKEVFMNVLSLDSEEYEVQSQQIKAAAIQQTAEQLSIPETEISISKDDQEVPIFLHRGQLMNIDLTLSHHGKFGAYMFAL